jgi:hypothetical protein
MKLVIYLTRFMQNTYSSMSIDTDAPTLQSAFRHRGGNLICSFSWFDVTLGSIECLTIDHNPIKLVIHLTRFNQHTYPPTSIATDLPDLPSTFLAQSGQHIYRFPWSYVTLSSVPCNDNPGCTYLLYEGHASRLHMSLYINWTIVSL